ncbi:MAG: hypothetical protein FH751_02735 [Firmicutes bacterium]|nr:hypothetical protein [Bacillota bacterium]
MDIKSIEEFLGKINSVLSSKVVVNKDKEITEIHVLSSMERSPKQISRDVKSALMSKFDLDIDYKVISIAQIDKELTKDDDSRLKLKSVETSITGKRLKVKVILEKDDKVYEGKISGPNTTFNSKRMLATATLEAIEKYLGVEEVFVFEDTSKVNLAGEDVIVTAVSFLASNKEEIYSGSSFIDVDIKESVVKSTLDAVNRRVMRHSIAN